MGDIPRLTSRGIVVHDGNLLLMERWRDGTHYFSIPGGLIEPGETAEQAAVREILEETTVRCSILKPVMELHRGDDRHIVYECQYMDGQPVLPDSAEEAVRSEHGNRYEPKWVRINSLEEIPFGYWDPLKQLLIRGLSSGFSDHVQVVTS